MAGAIHELAIQKVLEDFPEAKTRRLMREIRAAMPDYAAEDFKYHLGAIPDAFLIDRPPALIEPCILAGCPKGGTVLDPFGGAGTTGLVADRLGRNAILIELNPEYAEMARRRVRGDAPLLTEVT